MKLNKSRIDKIAGEIAKIAFKNDQNMTFDQLLDFLYSQVKSIHLNIEFSNERFAAKKDNKLKKEIEDAGKLEVEWEILKSKVDGLPEDNNGQPFYKGFFERVLMNQSIPLMLDGRNDFDKADIDPNSQQNKNNPFLYEGINNNNDFRSFLINKVKSNEMTFKNCIIQPFTEFSMPLDVYNVTARLKSTNEEVNVYLKFGIDKNKATMTLIFKNISFHPDKNQSKK